MKKIKIRNENEKITDIAFAAVCNGGKYFRRD